jgi:NADH dehydrogenase [ubiquinone] 1 alpha subcomplex assembly factor 6
MAIRAFNVEIARIPFLVSDPKIGEMRFKFWEDTIAKLFGKDNKGFMPEQNQPVVQELRRLLDDDSKKFTKRNFDRLWMARRNQSVNFSFLTTKQLEDYCEQSVSSVYYLLLENRNVKNLTVDHCASHLGKAQGIVNVLRSIAKAQRASNVPVPQELLMKHGVSQERVYRDKSDDKGVEECIFELSSTAHQHLEKSRSMAKSVPKEALPIFLPAIAIARYLERLRHANFHLTTKALTDRDSTLPIALYWNKLRGKF